LPSSPVEPDLKALAEEIEACGGTAIPIMIDVSQSKSVGRGVAVARERLGKIDIVINNAGVGWYKPFVEWTLEELAGHRCESEGDDIHDARARCCRT
jgi:short-subunit dehydrogenase